MLDILELFVQKRDYSYIRMDGATAIASRQPLVARFNTVSFVFSFVQCVFTPCVLHCYFYSAHTHSILCTFVITHIYCLHWMVGVKLLMRVVGILYSCFVDSICSWPWSWGQLIIMPKIMMLHWCNQLIIYAHAMWHTLAIMTTYFTSWYNSIHCLLVVKRTNHCLCSCWQHVLVDLASTWREPIELLYLTPTGIQALTPRPEREHGVLVSHGRSPSIDCWPLAPLRRKYITGNVNCTQDLLCHICCWVLIVLKYIATSVVNRKWMKLHFWLQLFVTHYVTLYVLSARKVDGSYVVRMNVV